MTPPELSHDPVLLQETLGVLQPKVGETIVDCTLGLGGHATAFLQAIGPKGLLIAFDADSDNIDLAKKNLQPFMDRIQIHNTYFSELSNLVEQPVDSIFADLGLCSSHIDDAKRGFSFRFNAPLDLRFNRSIGAPAAVWIEQVDEETIVDALKQYAEVDRVYKLAKALKMQTPQTTFDVVAITEDVYQFRSKKVLPQIFQALRIVVNDELEHLHTLLNTAPKLLKPGGGLAIMSYHSLEDRMVKQVFRALASPEIDPITGQITKEAPYTTVTKKPIVPGDEEVQRNPRSRSAKLRVLQRIDMASTP